MPDLLLPSLLLLEICGKQWCSVALLGANCSRSSSINMLNINAISSKNRIQNAGSSFDSLAFHPCFLRDFSPLAGQEPPNAGAM